MSDHTTRFVLTVPDDLAEQAENLKKEVFYDKPYAEMYRQLIKLGLTSLHSTEEEPNTSESNKP